MLHPQLTVFHRSEEEKHRHLEPLYLKDFVNGEPMTKVLVESSAAINLILYTTY